MSKTLEEALSTVVLEPGTSYSCEVHGLPVRVEVGTKSPTVEPIDIKADTMLDPWADLPRPRPTMAARARIVAARLPDPPPIPADE